VDLLFSVKLIKFICSTGDMGLLGAKSSPSSSITFIVSATLMALVVFLGERGVVPFLMLSKRAQTLFCSYVFRPGFSNTRPARAFWAARDAFQKFLK